MRPRKWTHLTLTLILTLASVQGSGLVAQSLPRFEIELEGGPFWLSRNDVQIPNDETGTRFSLTDLVGKGPWAAGRAHLTWNLNHRHALRAVLAPLSVTEVGHLDEPVAFAGSQFDAGTPVEGTYRFNSWRLGYRYRLASRRTLDFWVGFTAKLRDAEVRLRQGTTQAKDTDIGFVPLLHLAAKWCLASRANVLFSLDGLAGGPGRAFDAALKVRYNLTDRLGIAAGYRTLEGGADVDSVYNFAWLHYGVFSVHFFP
jgi:hypothetical protein